jgi:hypothetical protein
MKWTAKNGSEEKFDLNGFTGLVADSDGDIWFISDAAFICFEGGEQPWASDCETIEQLENTYGPFTKYNGKLVIEND